MLRRVTRRSALLLSLPLLLAAGFALPAPAAAGPIGINAFAGYYNQYDRPLVGAGVRLSLLQLTVNPNAEYVFAKDASVYTLNLDATWSVLPLPVVSAWVGGGLGRWSVNPDGAPERFSKTGINLLAGAGLNAVPYKPYAQIKYAIVPDLPDPLGIVFGVRF